jgi:hypothetical protein
MEEAPGLAIGRDPSSLDATTITALYTLGTDYLKSKVSYIWPGNESQDQTSRREKWSVSTWSTKIGRSQVVKRGTLADISTLAAGTRHNEPHSHRPRKKRQVTRTGFQNQHDQEEVDETLRAMITGLGTATQQRVEREIAETRRERELSRSRTRETTNNAGDRLIIDPGGARGRGASSRDPRYLEQLRRVVDGEVEVGPCGIEGCTFPDLALHHKCTTCGKYVHNPCAIQNGLFDEGNSTQSQAVRRYCRLACKPST